jgi:hypothetical protein
MRDSSGEGPCSTVSYAVLSSSICVNLVTHCISALDNPGFPSLASVVGTSSGKQVPGRIRDLLQKATTCKAIQECDRVTHFSL